MKQSKRNVVIKSFIFVRLSKGKTPEELPETELSFEVRVETELRQACRQLQRALQAYRDEKKGPTLVAVQAQMGECSVKNIRKAK